MAEVSPIRLHVLRALYLFIFAGLAITRWPGIVSHPADMSRLDGVVTSMLGAVSLLALLGVLFPLELLPLLFFELLWKALWVVAFWLPSGPAGWQDPQMSETLFACAVGIVLVPIALPWKYVLARYLPTRRSHSSSGARSASIDAFVPVTGAPPPSSLPMGEQGSRGGPREARVRAAL